MPRCACAAVLAQWPRPVQAATVVFRARLQTGTGEQSCRAEREQSCRAEGAAQQMGSSLAERRVPHSRCAMSHTNAAFCTQLGTRSCLAKNATQQMSISIFRGCLEREPRFRQKTPCNQLLQHLVFSRMSLAKRPFLILSSVSGAISISPFFNDVSSERLVCNRKRLADNSFNTSVFRGCPKRNGHFEGNLPGQEREAPLL